MHHGAHGHLEHQILARGAVHAAALAVRAALGLEMVRDTVVDQRRHAGIGLKHDVAAVPAVAAVRTAFRNVSLAAKRHAASAAVAAFHVNAYFIDKHDVTSIECEHLCRSIVYEKSPLTGRGLSECIDVTQTLK